MPHQTRFYTKISEYRLLDQKPNSWSCTKVEIFDKEQNDIKVGEYIRNYPTKTLKTFFPFKSKNGNWYALYSETYHRTYVMSLPDCVKIAECNTLRLDSEFDKSGFCPLSYWVPSVYAKDSRWIDKSYWHDIEEEGVIAKDYAQYHWHHLDFGFVYGCYWGGSYYIQKIDLSQIDNGVVEISNPFNPNTLPEKIVDFSQVIDIYVDEEEGSAYGVGVLGKSYMFHDGSNKIMTKEEEKELYKRWGEPK